jgi:predicted MFS family arabinose efflux permease
MTTVTEVPSGPADQAHAAESHRLIVPLVILACGHILSNLLRTMPAVTVDVMAADLNCTAQTLASLTAAYHFAFAALQIPVGVALDRFGVRTVSLTLFAGTILGACVAAMSRGPVSFFVAQLMLGVATSGMLMCPMTLAGRRLSPLRFGVWSGLILSLGNAGMLLSSSPLAWLVDHGGWRAGFWVSAVAGVIVAGLVMHFVPNDKPAQSRLPGLFAEVATVLRLGASHGLRGIVLISLVSLAVQLSLRGVWAGPWLMDIKGLSRIDAGNVLMLFTCALVAGPFLSGLLDRKVGHRRVLLLVTQLLAGGLLVMMASGAPGAPLSQAFGVARMPLPFDVGLLVAIGLLVSVQPLIYAMAREVVTVENTGKAFSALNLAFFLGTALMQSMTGPIAATWGVPAVLVAMAISLVVGSIGFFALTRRSAQPAAI